MKNEWLEKVNTAQQLNKNPPQNPDAKLIWRDNHTGLLPKQPVVILWFSRVRLDHGFRQKPSHCGLYKVEPRNNWRMGTPWEVSMESVNRELGWGETSRNPNGCGSFTCVKKPVGNRFLGIFSLFHSIQTTRQKKDSSLPTIVLFDLSVAQSVYSLQPSENIEQ